MIKRILPSFAKLNINYCCSSQKVGNTNVPLLKSSSDTFYGIKPVRRCTPQEIKVIEEAYKKVFDEGKVDQNHTEINWTNIFINGRFNVPENEFWKKFDHTVRSIFRENERPETKIYSYGFLMNPLHCEKDQFYHHEYAYRTGIMIIPLTYLTTKNSTQYLNNFQPKQKPKLGVRSYNSYGNTDIELLENENVDFLEVSQLICRPYTILKTGFRTIHRGVKNLGGFARPVVFMNYGDHEYTVQQGSSYTFTKNQQRREQLQKQGMFDDEYYKDA